MPKCLLPVGGKPLLERTIAYLGSHGFDEFVICVAYLKKQIMDTFKDGAGLGVKIEYAESESPLGTAGQLKTAERFIHGRFLAMNGDIVTNMNISNLRRVHETSQRIATIAVKRFEVKVPYGHITVGEDGLIKKFEEKPTLSYLANAGVYVLEERIFESIAGGRVSSLETETFPSLIAKGEIVGSYFEEASWADVGSMHDFERVNDEMLTADSETISERQ
jgi:mannose-1-phosphate guanylyltransferase/phosphomannomutase